MKFRHLEYFVAAAEELNFTHAADRLHVSQPPFSKQIHDLEGELRMELFERHRKGVALTPAGKAFLVDARRILEDCDASIKKAQRISRGEIGELAVGYMSALTHDFMGKALEVWRQTSPGIVVDCIEMDTVTQERALIEGRIAVGILVPSDRPVPTETGRVWAPGNGRVSQAKAYGTRSGVARPIRLTTCLEQPKASQNNNQNAEKASISF